jgi:hypothetical protein
MAEWKQESIAVSALYGGPREVVEGAVSNFRPMPYEGHQDECFCVHQQSFCYSDYEITPGFHQSASHGGPIHEGLPVRIDYHDGVILRLQIPADQVVNASKTAAVEKASEQEWQRRMDVDPVERRLMVAFYVTAVGWMIWWNVKWKLVMNLWVRPPYRRWTEIVLRLFFAADLASSLIGLVTYVWGHPVNKSAILPTLVTTFIMGAVVALMSLQVIRTTQRRQFARRS